MTNFIRDLLGAFFGISILKPNQHLRDKALKNLFFDSIKMVDEVVKLFAPLNSKVGQLAIADFKIIMEKILELEIDMITSGKEYSLDHIYSMKQIDLEILEWIKGKTRDYDDLNLLA
jgi:hypothetical protein